MFKILSASLIALAFSAPVFAADSVPVVNELVVLRVCNPYVISNCEETVFSNPFGMVQFITADPYSESYNVVPHAATVDETALLGGKLRAFLALSIADRKTKPIVDVEVVVSGDLVDDATTGERVFRMSSFRE